MNICVWFHTTDAPTGGGNQFLRALSLELIKRGHKVSCVPQNDTEIVLLNGFNLGSGILMRPGKVAQLRQVNRVSRWARFVHPNFWLLLRRNGPALVHRVDGVPKYARGYVTKADWVQSAVNRLCDYTIFQSTYSMNVFASVALAPTHCEVIFNGVDPAIFHPPVFSGKSSHVLRLVSSSWSNNPRKGFDILAELSTIDGIELNFIGRWPSKINSANVKIIGPRNSTEIADILRTMNVMVHAGRNEACSNSILEALACGLPILYRDSGGNREIAGEYGWALTGDYVTDIKRVKSEYLDVQKKVKADNDRFLIHHVTKDYERAFEKALFIRGQLQL
ncbi:MAG: glycosyltransferase family 4 protein [Anaerolineae bacterium]|nr:glycosyltransferase family 4 protein [Anaerolineae bacterium]